MNARKTVPILVVTQPRKLLALAGAYGRTAKLDDWRHGLDFYILITNGISGSYCSIRDTPQIKDMGYTHVVLLDKRCVPICDPLPVDMELVHLEAQKHMLEVNSEGTH